MTRTSRLWARIKGLAAPGKAGVSDSIQARDRFHASIMRERARADRNQHSFSLLLFDVGSLEGHGADVQRLAGVLTKRTRLADEAGWFDAKRVGVLLSHTSAAGAQRLAEDICQAVTTKASPPKYTIYTYPAKWLPNGDGHSAQLHFSDLFTEWKTTTFRGLSARVHADHGNGIFSAQQLPGDTFLNRGSFDQAVGPFLLRRMPFWKRAMDVMCALFGLVVLSPILLLIAVLIKAVSPGPVLFEQERVGYLGKTFRMLKFRTMHPDTDPSIHASHVKRLINGANNGDSTARMTKLYNHPQIIRFGKILRRTSLDELPQLINVLRGEMSLVGPRPPTTYEAEQYLDWHWGRFHAVPGMTGLWQVSGKNQLTLPDMARLDIRYSRQISFWSDAMILLRTPLAVFFDIKAGLAFDKEGMLFPEFVENA